VRRRDISEIRALSVVSSWVRSSQCANSCAYGDSKSWDTTFVVFTLSAFLDLRVRRDVSEVRALSVVSSWVHLSQGADSCAYGNPTSWDMTFGVFTLSASLELPGLHSTVLVLEFVYSISVASRLLFMRIADNTSIMASGDA
jgi:hypothetical protein